MSRKIRWLFSIEDEANTLAERPSECDDKIGSSRDEASEKWRRRRRRRHTPAKSVVCACARVSSSIDRREVRVHLPVALSDTGVPVVAPSRTKRSFRKEQPCGLFRLPWKREARVRRVMAKFRARSTRLDSTPLHSTPPHSPYSANLNPFRAYGLSCETRGRETILMHFTITSDKWKSDARMTFARIYRRKFDSPPWSHCSIYDFTM